MADEIQKIKVSELPVASSLDNLAILGVDMTNNRSVRALMSLLRGLDGKNIELQKSATHLQWRVTGGTWANLVALADLKGTKGDDGNPVEFQKSATHLQWRVTGTSTWNNLVTLDELKVKGDTGANIELQVTETHIQWRVQGASTWNNLIALSELEGDPGKNVELQKTSTHLQWRVTDGSWANLVALSEIKGAQGDGVSLQKTSTHIQWRLGTGSWANLVALEDLKGPGGDDALEPIFVTGTTTTLDPDEEASAEVVADGYTPEGNPKFKINLSIPKGQKGAAGDGSGNVTVLNYATGTTAKIYVLKPSANGSLSYNIEELDVKSETIVFVEAGVRNNITTGETIVTVFGKIKKWFTDLKSLAFKDKADWNTDIDNRPESMPASDVYSWAKAANKPTYSASETGALPESHNTDGSSHADIRSEVASVRLVAEGALVGYAFDTVAAMNSWIAVSTNKDKLKVGNSLFIRAIDVPDYWWDGTQPLVMETEKVDLSGYLLSSVAASTYVAKESGKSLMTDAERTKLTGIATGAQVNTVTSVAGRTGAITLTKSDVSLGNVDNTSDANKPVSTAQQTALDLKFDSAKIQTVASLPGSPDANTYYFIPE